MAKYGGTVVGEYTGTKEKIKVRCNKGHEFTVWTKNTISRGLCCSICSGRHPKVAKEKFLKRVMEKKGTLIGTYINTRERVLIRCERNHEWFIRPTLLMFMDSWCPHCIRSKEKSF